MKKKALTIVPVPLLEFPEHILAELPDERKDKLKKAGILEYISFKLAKPNLELIGEFITTSEHGKMKDVFLHKRRVCLAPRVISETLHIPLRGERLSGAVRLTMEEKSHIFGEYMDQAKTNKGWDLKLITNEALAVWLIYLNQRFFYNTLPEIASEELLYVGLHSWDGQCFDWSYLSYDYLLRELTLKKKRNPMALVSAALLSMICMHVPVVEELLSIQSISSSSVPEQSKEPDSAVLPPDSMVYTSINLSYDDLLKSNKEYEEKQRFMSLELNAFRTREAALKEKVRESEIHRIQFQKMHKEAKDALEAQIKEHMDVTQKYKELQVENKKTLEVNTTLRIRKEKMQEEINTLKVELQQLKISLETRVPVQVPETSSHAHTVTDLEQTVRLLVNTNEELNQELEKNS